MSELTGEADDEAVCEAAGVNERDQSTMPPARKTLSGCGLHFICVVESTFVGY